VDTLADRVWRIMCELLHVLHDTWRHLPLDLRLIHRNHEPGVVFVDFGFGGARRELRPTLGCDAL